MSELSPENKAILSDNLGKYYSAHKRSQEAITAAKAGREEAIEELGLEPFEYRQLSEQAAVHRSRSVGKRAMFELLHPGEVDRLKPFLDTDKNSPVNRRTQHTEQIAASTRIDNKHIEAAKAMVDKFIEPIHDMAVEEALENGVVIDVQPPDENWAPPSQQQWGPRLGGPKRGGTPYS